LSHALMRIHDEMVSHRYDELKGLCIDYRFEWTELTLNYLDWLLGCYCCTLPYGRRGDYEVLRT
jgi:hypothetical protein